MQVEHQPVGKSPYPAAASAHPMQHAEGLQKRHAVAGRLLLQLGTPAYLTL